MTADRPDPRHWPRPQALLLDAMGTLIGLRRSIGSTYASLATEHGLEVEAAAIDQAFPTVYRSAPPLAFPGLEGQELENAERQWWAQRIDAVLVAAGAAAGPPALHRDLYDRFADPGLWRVYDDVPTQLQAWFEQGLRLAVVSNFDQRLIGLLAGLGLSPWLEQVVISSRAGAAKPSALPFHQAIQALGLSAEQAWHIGDSPEDAAGAAAAGIRCLIVQRS
ncbi:MAG: HAD-IA family hydrolase [Synechococcaceae cyanobacterium ELA182]